jgi:hypothetical protein
MAVLLRRSLAKPTTTAEEGKRFVSGGTFAAHPYLDSRSSPQLCASMSFSPIRPRLVNLRNSMK